MIRPARPPAHVNSPGPCLLYVVNDTPYFLLHWLDRALAARSRGYEVHVAGSAGEGVARVTSEGLPFYAIPFTRGRSGWLTELRALRAVSSLYATVRPDLVHHITIKPVIYGGFAAWWRGVPAVVSTVPGLGYVFSQEGWRAALRKATVKRLYRGALAHPRSKVIFENSDDLSDFIEWRLIDEDRGLVIKGAGVDLDRFRPSDAVEAELPTVVLASRLLWDKGVGVFVEAAALVRRAHPEVRMILVGDNDPDSPTSIPVGQLEQWEESGLVETWGRRDDMPEILSRATLVCLPSFYREGIPRVLIEAAACGRPIVTTDSPGCREIVRQNENGVLVPAKDPVALAGAIGALLDDPHRRARMGRAGRARAEAEFGSPRVVAQTLAVYDQLVGQARPSHRSGLL